MYEAHQPPAFMETFALRDTISISMRRSKTTSVDDEKLSPWTTRLSTMTIMLSKRHMKHSKECYDTLQEERQLARFQLGKNWCTFLVRTALRWEPANHLCGSQLLI